MKRFFIAALLIFACTINLHSAKNNSALIASFNIQVFGKKKSSNPDAMQTIKQIISTFDIVAIQEIMDISGLTPRRLHYKLRKEYSYVIGPRVGYSNRRKEQYAFFYKKSNVVYLKSYTYSDTLDEFSRDPFIALFKLKNIDQYVTLINIHTPPKFATREVRILPDVIEDAIVKFSNKNVILLGDFNADCSYFEESIYEFIFPPRKYVWAIDNKLDTTVSMTDCTYDRIVLSINMLKYYDYSTGVLKFNEIYKLPYRKALKVSDHYPVWIKLIYEKPLEP